MYLFVCTERFFNMWGPAPKNKPCFPHIEINGLWLITSAYLNIRIYKNLSVVCKWLVFACALICLFGAMLNSTFYVDPFHVSVLIAFSC